MEDKLLTLHTNLIKEGYDLPAYDVFKVDMADTVKSKKLHDNLAGEGYDLPDYDTFLGDMGLKKKDVSEVTGTPSEVSSQEQPPLPPELQTPDLTLRTPELGFKDVSPVDLIEDYLQGKQIPRADPQKGSYTGDLLERIGAGAMGYVSSGPKQARFAQKLLNIPKEIIKKELSLLGISEKTAEKISGSIPFIKPQYIGAGIDISSAVWDKIEKTEGFKDIEEQTEQLRESSQRYTNTIGELIKNKEYNKAIGASFLSAAESLPLTLTAMFGGPVGLSTIGMYSGAEQYDQLNKNSDIKEVNKIANALFNGGLEIATERLGSANYGKLIKSLYNNAGKEVAEEAVKKGLKSWFVTMFKKFGIYTQPIGEGLEEGVNQIGGNMTAIITGEDSDRPINFNVIDAVAGGVAGGSVFATVAVPAQLAQKPKPKKPNIAEAGEFDYSIGNKVITRDEVAQLIDEAEKISDLKDLYIKDDKALESRINDKFNIKKEVKEPTKVEEEEDAETIRREAEEAGRPQELVEGEEERLRVRQDEEDRLGTEQREEVIYPFLEDVPLESQKKAYQQFLEEGNKGSFEIFLEDFRKSTFDPQSGKIIESVFPALVEKPLTPQEKVLPAPEQLKEKEAEIEPVKAEKPRKEVGVKFKDKTYTSVEEVQDDFADKKITFEENKKLLHEVNKFEDRINKEARRTSDNTYQRIDNLTRNAEETLQREINDKKSKIYSKFLPDIVAPISNLLYKPLVKIKDKLANSIAGELKKGVTTQNDALRWTTKVITNLYNGLVRTQEDMFGKGEEGKIGKLEMTGTTRTYARYKAKNLLKAWRDAVNSDNEALKRVWQVLDTELGTKAGETPLTEKDLNPSEQNLLKTLREWNTWVWSTNQANGITPTKSYLKFKGDFDKTGYSDYIARMYDKYEESTILSPEIREFVNRGNSSVTSKMVTDYMKLRKELVGAVEIDGKLYETIEELQQGLRDGEINRDQYNEVKDQIKSKEWRQEHAVKDPAYLTAKRVMQTIQNVAIKQYMDMIISQHPEYVLDVKRGEETPKGHTKLSSSYSWGPFRNKVVVDHIVEDFTGFFYKNATVNALYDGIKLLDRSNLNQFYKRWRTIYNPFVQVGNITGNVFFASVNGMNPVRFIAKMATSLNMDKKNLALYESLLKSGLMGDVAMTGEMKLEQLSPEEGIVKKIINKPMKWYAGADNVAKMAAYRIHREDGFTHEQAIRRTYDAFQNYSTVGKTWDLTSKIPAIGPTFVKFQADLQRIMLNNMLTTPLTTIGTFMLIKALGNLASTLSGESEEEREIREHRTGVPRIPIVNVPLSFKVGKSELNVARYLTPLFIYPQGDNEMDISEWSKFMPLQFQKKDKESLFPLPAFADATWGWLGSVLADRDFRMMAIQDPYSRRYKDVGITKDERRLNVLEFAMRSQVPFYKGTTDIIAGATGQLDYYGRNRTWQQSILNNIIKIQQFDKPELKLYMESRINYLTNRYTTLAQVAGNANKEVLTQIKKAEDKKLSREAIDKIYEKELSTSNKREQYALDRQIPILDELERLMNVYKKWNPEDEFVSSSFTEIEAGKMQLFRVLDEKDFMTKHKVEYKLLKDNNLLKKPDEIPTVYNGVVLTDVQKKRYMEEYWSTYLMYLDELIGLTQEDMNAAKEVITSMKPSKTKLKMEEENLLNENANEARRRAIQSAELVLGELIK